MPSDARVKREMSDRLLAALGLVIAGLAAFFPWYVFLNQDRFGIRPVQFATSNPPSVRPVPSSTEPAAVRNRGSEDVILDTVTTATVTTDRPGRKVGADGKAPAQAFPTPNPGFRLLHVANGRALIEDGKGMYMVHVGSVLPDDSRLATLEKRDGRWVIVTSDGTVIDR